MARKWVKLWVQESLTGTVRFDFSPAERGVWYDLLLLAGNCRLDGIIAAGSGKPYPHPWIAGTLNIPLELLETTLKKCEDTARIKENSNGIRILNWAKYQSEYERQKPYRKQRRKTPPLSPKQYGLGDLPPKDNWSKEIQQGAKLSVKAINELPPPEMQAVLSYLEAFPATKEKARRVIEAQQ